MAATLIGVESYNNFILLLTSTHFMWEADVSAWELSPPQVGILAFPLANQCLKFVYVFNQRQ